MAAKPALGSTGATLVTALVATLTAVAHVASAGPPPEESAATPAVVGRVVGPDGAPVEEARVHLADTLPENPYPPPPGWRWKSPARTVVMPGPRHVRTDREGRFRIEKVRPGRVTIWADHDRFLAAWTGELLAEDDAVVDVTIALAPGATVSGTVVGPDGAPVAGAEVLGVSAGVDGWLPPRSIGPDGRGVALTDLRGEFRLEGLLDGGYLVVVRAPGLVLPTPVLIGTGRRGTTIRLEPERTIRGVVTRGGRPATGVEVVVRRSAGARLRRTLEWLQPDLADILPSDSCVTGSDGRFEIRPLCDGTYTVFAGPSTTTTTTTASADVQTVVLRDVPAGTAELAIECPPGLSIGGSVVLPDGTPATSGEVTFTREDAIDDPDLFAPFLSLSRRASIRRGTFREERLNAGRYVVEVAGVPDCATATLLLAAGTTDAEIRLVPGAPESLPSRREARLTGRAVFPGGRAAVFAWIRLSRLDADFEQPPDVTDVSGRIAHAYLAPGEWRLTIETTDGGRAYERTTRFKVGRGERFDLGDFELTDVGAEPPGRR